MKPNTHDWIFSSRTQGLKAYNSPLNPSTKSFIGLEELRHTKFMLWVFLSWENLPGHPLSFLCGALESRVNRVSLDFNSSMSYLKGYWLASCGDMYLKSQHPGSCGRFASLRPVWFIVTSCLKCAPPFIKADLLTFSSLGNLKIKNYTFLSYFSSPFFSFVSNVHIFHVLMKNNLISISTFKNIAM